MVRPSVKEKELMVLGVPLKLLGNGLLVVKVPEMPMLVVKFAQKAFTQGFAV